MWPALFLTSNHSHIRQLQFATQAFSQKVLQQAVQISICQCFYPFFRFSAFYPFFRFSAFYPFFRFSVSIFPFPRFTLTQYHNIIFITPWRRSLNGSQRCFRHGSLLYNTTNATFVSYLGLKYSLHHFLKLETQICEYGERRENVVTT